MSAQPDLQPGDYVTWVDDRVGIVESAPFLSNCLLPFWKVVVIWDDEDGDGAYSMPSDVAGIVCVERNGFVIWGEGAIVQLELFTDAAS